MARWGHGRATRGHSGQRDRDSRTSHLLDASIEPPFLIGMSCGACHIPGERGLHFICFNAHIGRQFEFIQHTWLNNPKFDGLHEDDDPLVGDREAGRSKPGGTFTMQAEPVRTRVTGMPRFSQVRGGGYFFMPGIRAVRYLAALP